MLQQFVVANLHMPVNL